MKFKLPLNIGMSADFIKGISSVLKVYPNKEEIFLRREQREKEIDHTDTFFKKLSIQPFFRDWENIGKDFRIALESIEKERGEELPHIMQKITGRFELDISSKPYVPLATFLSFNPDKRIRIIYKRGNQKVHGQARKEE